MDHTNADVSMDISNPNLVSVKMLTNVKLKNSIVIRELNVLIQKEAICANVQAE